MRTPLALPTLLFFFVTLLLSSCGGSSARPKGPLVTGEPLVEWHITIGKDLAIDERVCWRGFTPDTVAPEMATGLAFTKSSVPLTGNGVRAKDAKDNCVRLTIDLDSMARSLDDETAVMRVGDAIMGSFDPWLWHPYPWPKGMHGRLVLEKPPEIVISLPHRVVVADANSNSNGSSGKSDIIYDVPFSTWSFMARFAIGPHLSVQERVAFGAQLSIVALPNATTAASDAGLVRFVEGAAAAVATIDDPPRMPTDRVQVLLRASAGGRRRRGGGGGGGGAADGAPPRVDPVYFGMAMRGAGPAVTLRLSDAATDEQLFGEWITTHELSHLWLPPVDREGAWLSEGLASYYQCVLRSRVGMYDEAQGWHELVSGFERGRAQAATDGLSSLRDARGRAVQHMYWGGAAIALKLDVLLRRNGSSLDAVVRSVRRSMDDANDRSADDMIQRLASSTKLDLLQSVRTWLLEPFPDTSEELRNLGIKRTNSDDTNKSARIVVLEDDAPLANLRRAIAGRR